MNRINKISATVVDELQSRFKQAHPDVHMGRHGGPGFELLPDFSGSDDAAKIFNKEYFSVGMICVVVYVSGASAYGAWCGAIVEVTGFEGNCVRVKDSTGEIRGLFGSRLVPLSEMRESMDADLWLGPVETKI